MNDLWNRVTFALRRRFSWGRSYRESGSGEISFVPQAWRELPVRYGLDRLTGKLDAHSFLRNLAKIDQLECLAKQAALSLPARPLRVLDIGSQDFVYAPALSHFFARWGSDRPRTVEITGIEIDPHRRRWSMHTRRDLARYYASLVPWTVCLAGDFLETPFPQRFDVVTWFRPHVALEPLLAAGLPSRLHRPQEQICKALECLAPGGALFLSYQSQDEAEMAQDMFRGIGVTPAMSLRWLPPQGAVETREQWLDFVRNP